MTKLGCCQVQFLTKIVEASKGRKRKIIPLENTSTPLVTTAVKKAVDLAITAEMAKSMLLVKKYLNFGKQGTSQNENVHSGLSAAKPQQTSCSTLDTLELHLSIFFYNWNMK